MNFIILFLTFALFSATSFTLRSVFVNVDVRLTFLVFGIVFCAVSFIILCVSIFQTFELRLCQVKDVNSIKCLKKKITLVQEESRDYVNKISESMMKIYPDHEKEIFKSISPADAEQLNVYLAKYPELKFNGVLEKHIQNINQFISNEYGYKKELENTFAQMRTREECGWYMFKKKLSQDIINEINQ